jgi:hypothetical protein
MLGRTNAQVELLRHLVGLEEVKGKPIPIKCAIIKRDEGYWDDHNNYTQKEAIILKEGYSVAEYEEFLKKLDFEYDNGYGMQELSGTVWLTEEGCWYERGEYDGSEWWEYKECPTVPNELKA